MFLSLASIQMVERALVGIAMFLLAVLPIIALVLLARWQQRRLNRYSEIGPTCDRCGYLLIGLQSDRCPECGTPVAGESIADLEKLGGSNAPDDSAMK